MNLSPAQRRYLRAMQTTGAHLRVLLRSDGSCGSAWAENPGCITEETVQCTVVTALIRGGWIVEAQEPTPPGTLPPFGAKYVLSEKGQLV